MAKVKMAPAKPVKIDIGIDIDVKTLLATRLLIQANSGGGKSWLLRKIIESVAAQKNPVQQIILDVEGEFLSLREKFDFALVAVMDGDIPLSVKYAEVLAHKILETNISVIIDLYELPHHERILFVAQFGKALINSPKRLWHPCLIYIDEADIFCPESGKAESSGAVIDICTRGRKRGFVPVLATQRLAELKKGAAAALLNKIIGRTSLDIDIKRAGDELGMISKKEYVSLRQLRPGEFYAFGPAISDMVVKFKVGKVLTTHLEQGDRMEAAPPTPGAIKRILSQLKDIPEVAEKDLQTKEGQLREIALLKKEIAQLKNLNLKSPQLADTKQLLDLQATIQSQKQHIARLLKNQQEAGKIIKTIFDRAGQVKTDIDAFMAFFTGNYVSIESIIESSENLPAGTSTIVRDSVLPKGKPSPKAKIHVAPGTTSTANPGHVPGSVPEEWKLSKAQRQILIVLAMYRGEWLTRNRVGLIANLKPTAGHFGNVVGQLRGLGYIQVNGQEMQITNQGIIALGPFDPLPTDPEQVIMYWAHELGKLPGAMLQTLFKKYPSYITRDQLAATTGNQPTGGHFGNCLGKLRTLKLIEERGKEIKLTDQLFN